MSFDCQFTLALGQRILQADIRTQARAVGIFGASGTGKTKDFARNGRAVPPTARAHSGQWRLPV